VVSRRFLNTARKRVTAQRILLLDLIRQGEGHLDAEELHRLAKKEQPRLSLSTVYRNLLLFKKLGLVTESLFDETHRHYEMKTRTDHHHLVCLGCGKVVEFESPLAQQIRQEVAEKKRFQILGTDIRLVGLCPDCGQKGR